MVMLSLVTLLMGLCFGALLGMVITFALMGPKLRDQFLGRNQDKKPLVFNWLDGTNQDIHVMMRGELVFIGQVRDMTLFHSGPSIQSGILTLIIQEKSSLEKMYAVND